MKFKKILNLLLSLLILGSCSTNNDKYISFKQYIDIVNEAKDNQKDIFIFTSSTCPQCNKIEELLKKYKSSINEEINLYELSVDYKRKLDGSVAFNDKTMGVLSGDSSSDGIKQLDNRLAIFVNETNQNVSPSSIITQQLSGNYMYMCTPIIIWYDSGKEVKMINNIENALSKSTSGDIVICHFNQPKKYTYEGLQYALKELRDKGYSFVKLEDTNI